MKLSDSTSVASTPTGKVCKENHGTTGATGEESDEWASAARYEDRIASHPCGTPRTVVSTRLKDDCEDFLLLFFLCSAVTGRARRRHPSRAESTALRPHAMMVQERAGSPRSYGNQ